jgi:hypothetical protein
VGIADVAFRLRTTISSAQSDSSRDRDARSSPRPEIDLEFWVRRGRVLALVRVESIHVGETELSRAKSGSGVAMKAANGAPVEVGQRWAYRKGARDIVACVDVTLLAPTTRIGSSRPLRVRVRFIDDEYEGREDWVPSGQLKVLWEHVDSWQASEDRWAAVRDISADVRDTPEEDAAGRILDTLPD